MQCAHLQGQHLSYSDFIINESRDDFFLHDQISTLDGHVCDLFLSALAAAARAALFVLGDLQ